MVEFFSRTHTHAHPKLISNPVQAIMPPLSTSYQPPTSKLDLFISDPESENEFECRSIPSRLYTIFEESSESENENENGAGRMNLDHGRDEMNTHLDAEEEAETIADQGPREDNEQMDLDDRNVDMVGDEDMEFDLAMILAGVRIRDGHVYRVPTVEMDVENDGEGADEIEDDSETSSNDRAAAQALERGQVMAGIVRAGEATEGFHEYDADDEDVQE